jgi:hypothetical protein
LENYKELRTEDDPPEPEPEPEPPINIGPNDDDICRQQ